MKEHKYYKTLDGLGWYDGFKPKNTEVIEITEEEWNNHLSSLFPEPKEPTETESRINELKSFLFETDYQAIKFAEGELTAEEYAPIKAQRRAWREEINQLTNK